MTKADNIEKKLEQMNIKSTPAMREKILSEASRAMEQAINVSAHKPSIGRIIMKSNITKFAAAAVIVIGVFIGINMLNGTPAWAEVLENINKAKSVVYKETSEIPKYTFSHVQMVSENGIIRSELEHGTIMIMDVANKVTLWLEPSKKEATRYGEPCEIMKKNSFSYIGWLRKLHEAEAEFIGKEKVDGQITNVYAWDVPFESVRIWIDPEVNLPVKVEHKTFANTDNNIVIPQLSLSLGDFGGAENISAGGSIGSSRGSGLGISQDTTRTLYDFQWDVELDESLFSLDPPKGYTLEQKYLEDSPIDNNILVYILGFWTKMNDGQFPTEEQLNDPEAFKPLIIEEYDKDGEPKDEFEQARHEVSRVLKGIYFIQEKKVDGSWGYNGEGVLLGQAEVIICWWFDEETGSYKAIYGDLSIEDVTEDQLLLQP